MWCNEFYDHFDSKTSLIKFLTGSGYVKGMERMIDIPEKTLYPDYEVEEFIIVKPEYSFAINGEYESGWILEDVRNGYSFPAFRADDGNIYELKRSDVAALIRDAI